MTINSAILGMLSIKPMAGYDLKKAMQDSDIMYWSGNNNQIYKVLVALHDDGYVTSETYHQEGTPSKKIYTITEKGLEELRRQMLASPEPLEIRKPFLVQLACAWQLSNLELRTLLAGYVEAVQGQRHMAEQARMDVFSGKTAREDAISRLIQENVIDTYRQELAWIDEVRRTLDTFDDAAYPGIVPGGEDTQMEEKSKMTYEVIEKGGQKYLYLNGEGRPIQAEQDGMDLLSLCIENGTNLLLIDADRLSETFYRLRTGVAGAILQKFTQYNIKTAVVMDESIAKGKFREFLLESNRGKVFRSFTDRDLAESWLLGS